MRIDANRVWSEINALIGSTESVQAKMLRVIAACEESLPHPDWQELKELDYARAVKELEEWFAGAVAREPPTIEVRGIWVGLCNPVGDGEVAADMYFAGTERFDRENPDWAVGAAYYPKDAYAQSTALESIYDIAYRNENGLANEAEWSLCLAFGVFAVRELLSNASPSLFRAVGPIGVSVGFDSGDYIDLGELSSGGFRLFGSD